MLYREVIETKSNDYAFAWQEHSCCFKWHQCEHRRDWVNIDVRFPFERKYEGASLNGKLGPVPLVKIYGLNVALGNGNFHTESYRSCNFSSTIVDICP